MGSLSKLHRQGRIRRQTGRKETRPLRKVVGTEGKELIPGEPSSVIVYEVLECGHRQRPRQDFMGEYHAASRRCGKCPRKAP